MAPVMALETRKHASGTTPLISLTLTDDTFCVLDTLDNCIHPRWNILIFHMMTVSCCLMEISV